MDNDARRTGRRRFLNVATIAVASLASMPLMHRAIASDLSPINIGIIGTGRIGGTLAELWAKAGHAVLLSSRHPERLEELAARLGPLANTGYPQDAARFGEVVLIAVPYHATPQVGRDYATELRGKIVLDAGNPQPHRDGDMAHAARAKGAGLASAEFLPDVRLVRAFNTLPWTILRDEAHRAGEPVAIPLASDDVQALEIASRLVREAGFEPVVVGPLERAREFDVGARGYGGPYTARQL
ncbi:MAG TPA: NADPH-dependent F420 reductase, partial [Rhodocyclaceae bacterium]|nr:NADPH-dependent F420 reductase [Rhodocyclaceae bacterium]